MTLKEGSIGKKRKPLATTNKENGEKITKYERILWQAIVKSFAIVLCHVASLSYIDPYN